MTINIEDVVENDFSTCYTHFKEFQHDSKYKLYWDKCMEAVRDKELLGHIIFCNDTFQIPPVKTFLTYYKDDFKLLTGDEKAVLDTFVKRSIGTFWGMVFKFALGYTEQKSVSVSMNEYFMVKTASVYGGKPNNITDGGNKDG